MGCAPWNPLGCASDIAKSAASDAFSSIAHDFGKMADSAVNWLWAQTTNATAVHLGGSGFSLDFEIVAAIAVTVAVGLFTIQLIASTLRRDPGGLGRAGKGLVVAFIGGGLAIGATNLLLAAVDSLSAGVVEAATGESLPQVGHQILSGTTLAGATTNPAGIIVFSMAALIAVVIVWAALTVRKVLIVISAVFAPLAFAGSLADITASWVRRWIEVTVALIVSKLILVVIFVVGLDILVKGVGQAGGGAAQGATQAVSGLLVLALAGFAPWLALKLVHFSGDQFHQVHGLASASASGARKAVQAPQKAMPWMTGGAGAGAGLAAGAAGRSAAGGAGAAGRSGPSGTGSFSPSRSAGNASAAPAALVGQMGGDSRATVQPATATATAMSATGHSRSQTPGLGAEGSTAVKGTPATADPASSPLTLDSGPAPPPGARTGPRWSNPRPSPAPGWPPLPARET